jgi:hypothetical protein
VSWYAMNDTKKGVVSLLQHLRDLDDLGVSMEVTSGGMMTPLSPVRLFGRELLPRGPWTCLEVRS